ncbi:unnamed protein product [Leuciscus chuanchicus]
MNNSRRLHPFPVPRIYASSYSSIHSRPDPNTIKMDERHRQPVHRLLLNIRAQGWWRPLLLTLRAWESMDSISQAKYLYEENEFGWSDAEPHEITPPALGSNSSCSSHRETPWCSRTALGKNLYTCRGWSSGVILRDALFLCQAIPLYEHHAFLEFKEFHCDPSKTSGKRQHK